MRKFTIAFLVLFVAGISFAFAQVRTITGTVASSEDGSMLPGVTVMVKGTTNGTTTDVNGYYTLNVGKEAKVLIFSFVGMQSQEVEIGNSNTINVVLKPSNLNLNEVVVVGYGTSTKQSFVGSVKTVKAENIESKDVANVSQALAGEAAGVQVINTSGQPGTVATIRIRGYGSVNGSRDPLYVLDGVPYSGSLNSLDPNNIKSVSILKDATATAIYGSKGANGVILITTKTGAAGTSRIEVSAKTGVNYDGLPRYSVIKSPEQYIGLSWEAMYNYGVASGDPDPTSFANSNLFGPAGIDPKYNMWNVTGGADLIDPTTRTVLPGVTRKYNPENWEDYAFQNSNRHEFNITMSGGNEKTKYFTSIGLLKDNGYSINSNFQRYNAMLSLQHQVKKWLYTSAIMSFARSETNNNGQEENSNSVFWFVDNIPSIFPLFLRDASGAKVPDPIFGGYQYDYGVGRAFAGLTNSIADAHYNKYNTIANQFTGNYRFNIEFMKGLTLENTFATEYYNSKYNNLTNPFYGSAVTQGGSVYKYNTQMVSYDVLNLLRYKKSFGDHNIEALAAHEANYWQRKVETASMSKMVDPNIDDLNNFVIVSSPPTSYTDNIRLESYFGQLNYNYQNTYYFTFAIRRDGSSRFIGKNKWGTFGSAGLSWIMSKANFMRNISFVKFLKLKVSYGTIGDQQGIGFYPGYNTFDISNLDDQISISARDIGNPDLTWESSRMFQTGIEFSIGNYLDGSIDYYQKNTSNLLFQRRVGPSVGYAFLQVNDGLLRNRGIEFDFTAHIINKKDFGIDFTVNGSFLKNKLVKMPIDPATGEPKLLDVASPYGRAKDHSLFDFYMREWAGVDPADGTAMWYEYYYDANGNGALDSGEGISSLYEYQQENPNNAISKTTTKTYTSATLKYVGKSAIPVVRGAFKLSAHYKSFDFGAQFLYSMGGWSYDYAYATLMSNDNIGGNNWHTDIMNRWQQPGDITNVPRLSNNFDVNGNALSTRFLTKSDFLALNNIRLGYTPPKKFTDMLGFKFSVYVSGDNLFLMSARNGFNPAASETGATSMYQYAPLSTYVIGIKASF
ncbi:MAG: SusC/RagA family TonB-linked outer membrane protein [Bacteroidales bacterium]|nr:SusC/RagA family TonB-linked outer membrane protein [Bacteroidales bacterium]